MSFPISPSNNEIALVNGIEYYYLTTKGAWYRYGDGSANVITSNTFQVLSSIVFSDGTSQATAANPTDAYARTTANAATSNIVILQGVNTDQNTRITISEGVDVGQNTRMSIIEGVDTTQNTRITVAEGVDLGQNTRMGIIEGVDVTQNTNITAADTKAQAAFNSSNTKLSLSGGTIAGNVTANSVIANNSIYAPVFYSTGATSRLDLSDIGLVAITVAGQTFQFGGSGIEANQGVFGGSYGGNRLSLNNETNLISNRYATVKIQTGTDGTVSNTWTFSGASLLFPDGTTQNTAFDSTTFSPIDTYARTTANAALTLANTANTTASAGGGSATSFTSVVDTFTGNGSQTQFTLSVVPDTENSTFVYLNGVYQNKSTYSVVGANVVFTDIATANDVIEVTTVAGSVMNVSPAGYSTRIYQGNGSTTAFTISAGQTANTVMVFNNGVCQFPVDDYTVSGTTLTYVLAPESDETVQIREMPINQLVAVIQPKTRRYTANGVQTTFTVTTGQSANTMFVYENGVCQMPINDYTVSGTTLTFTTAPTVDKVIQIREMPV